MPKSIEPELVLIGLDDGDVVWGERVESDRAVLRSIPSPNAGFRWLDEIVVIPEPVTQVELSGIAYPLFEAHGRAEGSGIPTIVATVACTGPEDAVRLAELVQERGWRAEDWTDEVRIVCTSCIDAAPDPGHRHDPRGRLETRMIAIAGRSAEIEPVLRRWETERPGCRRRLRTDEER
jgi:hypothetical protein